MAWVWWDVWVDMSSLATEVLLEVNGLTIEDVCLLHPKYDVQYINLAG